VGIVQVDARLINTNEKEHVKSFLDRYAQGAVRNSVIREKGSVSLSLSVTTVAEDPATHQVDATQGVLQFPSLSGDAPTPCRSQVDLTFNSSRPPTAPTTTGTKTRDTIHSPPT
jgi:hypothetical protein